jgi:hypothetical protein
MATGSTTPTPIVNPQLGDSEKVTYTLTALDAARQPAGLSVGDTVSVTSSDTAMATVVPDTPPAVGALASGFIVGGQKLGTVTITATASKVDGSVDLTVVDLIDIVGGAATSLHLGLGSPVPQ